MTVPMYVLNVSGCVARIWLTCSRQLSVVVESIFSPCSLGGEENKSLIGSDCWLLSSLALFRFLLGSGGVIFRSSSDEDDEDSLFDPDAVPIFDSSDMLISCKA